MRRGRRILIALGGLALVGVGLREAIARRLIERRYHEAVEDRQRLELRVGEMLATHDRLKEDLQNEQQRSQGLSESLASTHGQLEEMTARLTEEHQAVRTLQVRVTSMQQQMDQLQGELALALQVRQRDAATQTPGPVQLERVVVTNGVSSSLRGRVVSVHREWDFIVINLGWDAVRVGDTVSIFRDDQLLAKARVDRVQEDVCAATVLPEWDAGTISVNDAVQIL